MHESRNKENFGQHIKMKSCICPNQKLLLKAMLKAICKIHEMQIEI
uniref:Uncharacterized protein n=1 Tax=Strigamia maritima TaxID=126957 RepID=T1JNY1_STRMM